MVLVAACSSGGNDVGSTTRTAKPAATGTTGTTATTGTTVPSTRSIRWRRCSGGGQCGELAVPRDYAQPNGPTIKVAVLRYPATHPKERIGPLLVNPGGPGASAVQFLRDDLSIFPASLRNRFDLVAVDSRGTGATIPVDCHADLDAVNAVDNTPNTPAEQQHIADVAKQLAAGCEERSGAILPYVSTQSSARDLDQVRAALGAPKLTYVGYSYGTYLGALYANFFPDRVRAFVLDGAVDPLLSSADASLQQSVGFEKDLQAFFADCAATHEVRVPKRRRSGRGVRRASSRRSIANPCRPARTGAVAGSGPARPTLASPKRCTAAPERGPILRSRSRRHKTATGPPCSSCRTNTPIGSPTAATARRSRGSGPSPASIRPPCPVGSTGCMLSPQWPSRAAPHFGEANVNLGTVCDFWPVPPVADPGSIHAPGAPPILVIGTTGDPATPLTWAESLAKQLDSGRLLIAKGEQHTSFLGAQNSCVDKIVIKYLVQLQPPATGTRCN